MTQTWLTRTAARAAATLAARRARPARRGVVAAVEPVEPRTLFAAAPLAAFGSPVALLLGPAPLTAGLRPLALQATTLDLTASTPYASYGDEVTLTAAASPTTPSVPTGTVTFYDGRRPRHRPARRHRDGHLHDGGVGPRVARADGRLPRRRQRHGRRVGPRQP